MRAGRMVRKVPMAAAALAPIVLMVTALIAGTPAIPGDFAADMVLGQADFTHNVPNRVKAGGIYASAGGTRSDFVAIDARSAPNHLYVSDTGNSRVLGWRNATAFVNGAAADLVIGQPNSNSYWANNGGISASSLNNPTGVAVDSLGNLYVGDSGNSRVLEFTNPFAACAGHSRVLEFFRPIPLAGGTPGKPGAAGDTTADLVFGQGGSFTSNSNPLCFHTQNADTLCFPSGIAVDPGLNVFIAESGMRAPDTDTPPRAMRYRCRSGADPRHQGHPGRDYADRGRDRILQPYGD
jgi:NHL repeat